MNLRRGTIAVALILALAPSGVAAQAAGADAPPAVAMFRVDAANTGAYAGPGVEPTDFEWAFQAGGKLRSTPAVAGELILQGSEDGHLYALAVGSGEVVWKVDLGGPVTSSPAVVGGVVYAVGGDGHLHALKLATGEALWTFRTGEPLVWERAPDDPRTWDFYDSSPTVADGTVYFGSGDGHIYAVKAADGTLRWKVATGGVVRATPAVAGGTVFVGGIDGKVYAVDAATGESKWTFDTEGNEYFPLGEVQSSPAVAGGLVLFGARDGFLYAVDAASGEERWRVSHGGSWVITSPAVSEGRVFAGSSDGEFFQAVALEDGKELWRFDTGARVFSSPVVAGGLVYFGNWTGDVFGLDVRSGGVATRLRVETSVMSSPVVADGRIFVASDDSRLYSFIGGTYDPAELPQAVDVAPELLAPLVGRYEPPRGGEMIITLEEGTLKLTVGAQVLTLVPTSETEFFLKETPIKVRFVKGEDGEVEGLELIQKEKTTVAKRVS